MCGCNCTVVFLPLWKESNFEDIFLDLSGLYDVDVCRGESGNTVIIILHSWVCFVGLSHGFGGSTGASKAVVGIFHRGSALTLDKY